MAEYLKQVTGGRATSRTSVVKNCSTATPRSASRDEPGSEAAAAHPLDAAAGHAARAERLGHAASTSACATGTLHRRRRRADARRRRHQLRAICLAPQNSRTSVGLYRGASRRPLRRHGDRVRRRLGRAPAARPGLRRAHRGPSGRGLRHTGAQSPSSSPRTPFPAAPSPPARSLANAHGPELLNRHTPDPYPVECQAHRPAHRRSASPPSACTSTDWFFSFQSQGLSGGPWIGRRSKTPSRPRRTKDYTRRRHAARRLPLRPRRDPLRHRHRLPETAAELGLNVSRAESLNDSPTPRPRHRRGRDADSTRPNTSRSTPPIALQA